MTNILSNGLSIYSINVIPKKSLKQTLQVYADSIHIHVLYTFIKTDLLKYSQTTNTLGTCKTLFISILSAIVSAILLLILYPVKLAILAIGLCLKDPEITTLSPLQTFVHKIQDITNQQLYIDCNNLSLVPESSPFLQSFLTPETQPWELSNLENEISSLCSTLPEPWEKILNYVYAKHLKNQETSPKQEISYEGSLYYTVLQKLTIALQNPTIPKDKKQQLLDYIGSYVNACPPTWIEVIFRELAAIYNKQDTSINYVLLCVQMFKENLLQSIANRASEEWHHISSFKHYHGRSLGLNMDSLVRIQFTGYLILKKQALYNRVYKQFLANYRASVKNLIEYIRYQITDSSQELKNSLSLYLYETMRKLEVPEHEISSVLSSLFYDEQFELNTKGVVFILLQQGILTTEAQTTIEKITHRLRNLFL
ncbi:Domain of Unknown Function (DUF1548) [Chlamydia poikilotherma]|uniref:Uncharacterized protein n=1 Tax=Chlamydia poikilotherma TaxID=1967783 RepID=A0A3B0Q140_9CHLA|nr:DUF1548 domain-containing protein [Chlamydia poikilotherma]SYX09265.1 Domain of Unknown Function (DUF1548) [Chlamydia poikilotherma]